MLLSYPIVCVGCPHPTLPQTEATYQVRSRRHCPTQYSSSQQFTWTLPVSAGPTYIYIIHLLAVQQTKVHGLHPSSTNLRSKKILIIFIDQNLFNINPSVFLEETQSELDDRPQASESASSFYFTSTLCTHLLCTSYTMHILHTLHTLHTHLLFTQALKHPHSHAFPSRQCKTCSVPWTH